MTKLKKEELLRHLKDLKTLACSDSGTMWIGGWNNDDEQAYQQIRELIQKPEVTEEWIDMKAASLMQMMDDPIMEWSQKVSKTRDFILTLVEEIRGVSG